MRKKWNKNLKKLEEYSGLKGRAVYDYCSRLGVLEIISEPFLY